MTPDQRASVVAYLQSLVGTAYEWNGKHYPPPAGHYGLDCSGTVCCAYEAAGVIAPGYRIPAHDLADHCDPVDAADALEGDLVFYHHGGGPVTHVMVILDAEHVIGAQGGGAHTTTPEIAASENACVKVRGRAEYRAADVVCAGRWRD